ncbi:MAG: molybdate ABC transporter substrate-binding protein [Sulfurospirillaceae bacterium]|nr:molybdate ABC transporter substrate-binding protein [Sulfurospirillaceae bacterium]
MKKIVIGVLALFMGTFLCADSLKIAVGAGYKKPVLEVLKAYEATHPKVDAMYGNMSQIFAYAKQEEVALVIGDKKFLEAQKEIRFVSYQDIGLGRAVIVYAKGMRLDDVLDISKESIQKIAMPEPKKAIYGDAAMEFLNNTKLYDKVKEKLIVVATVPQVATYVITHEVDMGILNLTAALDAGDKIGGFVEIPSHLYTKIEITAGSLDACSKEKACGEFLTFLSSPKAKEIFTKYGL